MSEPQPIDPVVAKMCESLGAKIKAAPPTPDPGPPAKVIQLPLWPEPLRGTPNSFLRSALFAAIQGKTRRWMKKEFLGSLQGISVSFTGQQLDQSDLDVWEQAVHLARLEPLGHTCQFTGYAFLKALGRSVGKANYQWLHDAILRLVACAVEIRNGPLVFTGSLLSSCERDETSGLYSLTLDPKTIRLYQPTDWTALDWEQRNVLRGKALALEEKTRNGI
jgi:TrfA protein